MVEDFDHIASPHELQYVASSSYSLSDFSSVRVSLTFLSSSCMVQLESLVPPHVLSPLPFSFSTFPSVWVLMSLLCLVQGQGLGYFDLTWVEDLECFVSTLVEL